jgi:hypothetical protein
MMSSVSAVTQETYDDKGESQLSQVKDWVIIVSNISAISDENKLHFE